MLASIKKILKNAYKNARENFFFLLYEKPKYLKKKKLNGFFAKNLRIQNRYYKIYELNNGRVFTDKNDITAYITKDNYLTEGSLQFKKKISVNSINQEISKNLVLKYGTTNFKKKINGNVLSLLSGGASRDNFTHWFTDVIPRIILFKKKYKIRLIDKFYVPSLRYNFQLESLRSLNIKFKQIISSENIKHIEAKKIFYTSHPCHFYPKLVQKWSINALRDIYIPKKLNKNKKYSYVFIDRDQRKFLNKKNFKKFSYLRILLNENEIKNYLKSKGFKIIKPENFSFKEQIKIIYSAKIIIGLYGAAMMMLAFCNLKAKIIEIMPRKSGNDFKNISKNLNLTHEQIRIKPKFKSSIPQNGLIICDLNLIKKKLIQFGMKL